MTSLEAMSPQPGAERPARTPIREPKKEALCVLAALLAAYAFCELVLFGGYGLSVTLFALLFYAALAFCLRPRLSREAVLTLIPAGLTALCFAVFDNGLLRFFNVLALTAFTVAHMTALSAENTENRGSLFTGRGILACLKTFFIYPLCNLGKSVRVLGDAGGARRKWRTALTVLLSLAVVSPVILLVLQLLMSSDASYGNLIRSVTRFLSANVLEYATKILTAVLLVFPLYSLFYSLRFAKANTRAGAAPAADFFRIAGRASTVSVLWVFVVIYATYMISQFGYLFAAYRAAVPGGFTYAGYARRGFFELIAVAFINLLLTGAAMLLAKTENGSLPRICRGSLAALSVMTLLIIGTALAKMILYISIYDLTPLRVYAFWFMTVLACLFVLILIKTAAPRFPLLRASLFACAALYLLLNFADTDRLIARYNVDRYLAGRSGAAVSRSIDLTLFDSLSDGMVPELVRLKDDPLCGGQAREILRRRAQAAGQAGWKNASLAEAVARQTARSSLAS